MAIGYTLVTVPTTKSVKEKDIDFILNILQSEKCAFAILSYYMVIDMLNCSRLREYDLSSLKYAATTGQHVHTEVLKRLKAILPHSTLIFSYGLTEACFVIGKQMTLANAVVGDDVAMEIMPPFEVRIIDEDRRLVEVGTVGQISVRSPTTFLGYLDDADETSKVISSTGWVHTGDVGSIDQRGKLTVSGRRSDMIKRATVKIYPAEVEQMIIKYPEVNDVAVVGVPDVRLYEELCACVIPKQGRPLDARVFEEWASQQFPVDEQGLSMKPKYTLVMEEFPKTRTGKIDRKALREIAVGKLGIL
jgi:acyl-CoA synthetase (AMP-forming)/AMP-acid ligase II